MVFISSLEDVEGKWCSFCRLSQALGNPHHHTNLVQNSTLLLILVQAQSWSKQTTLGKLVRLQNVQQKQCRGINIPNRLTYGSHHLYLGNHDRLPALPSCCCSNVFCRLYHPPPNSSLRQLISGHCGAQSCICWSLRILAAHCTHEWLNLVNLLM